MPGENVGPCVGVNAEMRAQGYHFIGEADFQRVITVRKILYHFGDGNGRLVESAGSVLVELAQRRQVVGRAGSRNGVGRAEEGGDGAAFARDLRLVRNGGLLPCRLT